MLGLSIASLVAIMHRSGFFLKCRVSDSSAPRRDTDDTHSCLLNMSMISPTMPAGCWDLDLATGSLKLCPRSRRMFGLSPHSSKMLTESEWVQRLHPDDLAVVRQAMRECLVHQIPYAERFRTIHPDGTVQIVLGIGRPLAEHGEHGRFVGWNFDLMSAGELVAEWISAHPEAFGGEHVFSIASIHADPSETSPESVMTDDLDKAIERLTSGQIDCLMLVQQHLTSKEIAPILGISPHTVDQRIRASLRTLGCVNRAKAAQLVASRPMSAFHPTGHMPSVCFSTHCGHYRVDFALAGECSTPGGDR